MWKEFKKFAVKGNVIDLAIGVVIGTAFGKIVTSLVNDIIMPLIGLVVGKVNLANLFIPLGDSTYTTIEEAQNAGVATINYGLFLNNILDFIIIAFSIFLIIRQINKIKSRIVKEEVKEEPTTKTCKYCYSTIHKDASKCPNCTSDLT
ncbi:MAG TPA: large conductance mechanosensitive channel protein MscL [Acholeplasmataceae bacterium]|jgi:large conductance mechanosensitive channel|nr:large conductance mechanosensitive channel protein MscL [Acholeplasmataceae bacterium]